jgi:hypothetical protein
VRDRVKFVLNHNSHEALIVCACANLRREAKKVLNVLRMEPVQMANTSVAAVLDLVMKVMRKMIEREMQVSGVDDSTIGFLVQKTDEEVLREYVES